MSNVIPDDDAAWFTALVREQQRNLRCYVARRVPAAEVDDVVSEVFATLWRSRQRRPAEPRLWLYRCAHHLVLHEYRSRQRRDRLTGRLAGTPVDDVTGAADDSDAQLAVHAAMLSLSDTDRELLQLHYWEHLSIGDIATVLDARPETTRVRLHRARRRLAAALPDWLAGPLPGSPAAPSPAVSPRPTDLSCDGVTR